MHGRGGTHDACVFTLLLLRGERGDTHTLSRTHTTYTGVRELGDEAHMHTLSHTHTQAYRSWAMRHTHTRTGVRELGDNTHTHTQEYGSWAIRHLALDAECKQLLLRENAPQATSATPFHPPEPLGHGPHP